MWIKRLQVTDWAGIAAAAIDFDSGLNVLHGPNELGKSNLVRAIRAALLLQSTSAAAEPWRDWDADAPPEVTLTFEEEAQRVWRVAQELRQQRRPRVSRFLPRRQRLHSGRQGARGGRQAAGHPALGPRNPRRPRWQARHGRVVHHHGAARRAERCRRRSGQPASLPTPTVPGRERLTEALQAMAEDPRFKQVLARVQEKVDEAFTATGRRRSGQTSPWNQIREQYRVAEANERDVRQQMEDSEGARLRIEELHGELLSPQRRKEIRRRAFLKGLNPPSNNAGRAMRPRLPSPMPRPSSVVSRRYSTAAMGTLPQLSPAARGSPN